LPTYHDLDHVQESATVDLDLEAAKVLVHIFVYLSAALLAL
jgi:hypothetical protein